MSTSCGISMLDLRPRPSSMDLRQILIINAETEELKNACSRAAVVLRDHGLLTCALLADWGESIDPNILMPPSSSTVDLTKPDVKPRAFND
eukprot:11325950-Prorocentrum_lima.AAC.1